MAMAQEKLKVVPPTEVTPRAKRRSFSAAYKRQILQQVHDCERGQVGVLLRREGLYSSLVGEWRKTQQQGELQALEPKPRGPKPNVADERDEELARLRRENDALKLRAVRAERLVEIQKKVAELLGTQFPDESNEKR